MAALAEARSCRAISSTAPTEELGAWRVNRPHQGRRYNPYEQQLNLSLGRCIARRISKSVHYSVVNQTYEGQDPHELLRSAPATSETLFTDAMLAKVYTLIPLVWR